MLVFKIVASFLLLWFVAGLIGLIFHSAGRPRFMTSLTVLCAAVITYYLWLA